MKKRMLAVILALVFVLNLLPVSFAAESTETPSTETTQAAEPESEPAPDPIPEGSEAKLLYNGDETVSDEDAMIIVFVGDGFTIDEQESFFKYAQGAADYLMQLAPWNEFEANIKIYAIGTPSNESGVKGDTASNYNEALADTRDTYFGASYWSGGSQRIMELAKEQNLGAAKEAFGIESAADVVLVNAQTEGGTAYWADPIGNRDEVGYVILSVDPTVNTCTAHELGHLVAWLADEYWGGYSSEKYVNMTQETDPEKVKWARYIGMEDIGIYEYPGAGEGWYHPSQTCMMQYLNSGHYCAVCADALRDEIAARSNVVNMQFTTYGDQFYEDYRGVEPGNDMAEYFILRQGENKATGADEGVREALELTYYDADGKQLSEVPSEAGEYTVKAVFSGNETFDACEQEGTYTIQLPDLISINVSSKNYDGQPAEMTYTVAELDESQYFPVVTYSGTYPYSKDPYQVTTSSEAPVIQGSYTVTVAIYNKESYELITKKSASFEIGFRQDNIVYNSDPSWPGADSSNSNFTYFIFGDGYTAEEEDKFLADAKEFASNLLNQYPFYLLASNMNLVAVFTPSNTSGISDPEGDTYFGLTCDENGVINANANAGYVAGDIGYEKLDPFYRNAFILVNDENVTQGNYYVDYHGAVFTTPDEAGAEYAARVANEIFVGGYYYWETEDIRDYVDWRMELEVTEEDREEWLVNYLEYLAYWAYTVILTDTPSMSFVENGEPVDITEYIRTYNASSELPNDLIDYEITYYADDNGEVGEALEGAPSAAGTYHAFITQVPTNNWWGDDYFECDGEEYCVSKAWVTFTVNAAEPDPVVPSDPVPSDPVAPSDPVTPTNPGGTDEPGQTEPGDEQPPKTGDNGIALYVAVLLLSGVAITAIAAGKRKYVK